MMSRIYSVSIFQDVWKYLKKRVAAGCSLEKDKAIYLKHSSLPGSCLTENGYAFFPKMLFVYLYWLVDWKGEREGATIRNTRSAPKVPRKTTFRWE